jgi:hypothetical protein
MRASRFYRYLQGCDLSPALRSYVTSCLRQLAAINPEIRVDEPFRPRAARASDSCKPRRHGAEG